jgi:hypothetical protein
MPAEKLRRLQRGGVRGALARELLAQVPEARLGVVRVRGAERAEELAQWRAAAAAASAVAAAQRAAAQAAPARGGGSAAALAAVAAAGGGRVLRRHLALKAHVPEERLQLGDPRFLDGAVFHHEEEAGKAVRAHRHRCPRGPSFLRKKSTVSSHRLARGAKPRFSMARRTL